MIKKYPHHNWDWDGISANPNITMKYIRENIDDINFWSLSGNTFGKVVK